MGIVIKDNVKGGTYNTNISKNLPFWTENQKEREGCGILRILAEQTNKQTNKQTPWPLIREWTLPTDRLPLVDEI
jgi:hypothetical protein